MEFKLIQAYILHDLNMNTRTEGREEKKNLLFKYSSEIIALCLFPRTSLRLSGGYG